MIASKHIDKFVAVIVAAAVLLCFLAMGYSSQLTVAAGGTGVSMSYESKLFDTSEPLTVNIIMENDQWQEMLDNAAQEVYYQCDVEIGGETFYRVGIRPKGNTSLSNIANDPDTDRYSFKLEFDHYVDGQTCYGLDKLVLNNNYADATNMKEALIYDMYQYLGADASLYNYAAIYVNGEYWGVYLALEAVEESFLTRNYGVSYGELYKPDSMDFGDTEEQFNTDDLDFSDFNAEDFDPSSLPDNGNFDFSQFSGGNMPNASQQSTDDASTDSDSDSQQTTSNASADSGSDNQQNTGNAAPDFNIAGQPDGGNPPSGDFDPSDLSDFGGGAGDGGFSAGGNNGADLNYTDDDLDSYSAIWDGEVTSTKKSDHERVVTALKNISEGTDLETYLDIDNLLKYMAVHVFSVNDDSLTGTMAHNYYLYEKDGQLNMLPWDYNLSFGGMTGSDASSVINDSIDGAFSCTNFFDTLLENEEYNEKYHSYLLQLVEEYINGGAFDEFYERTRSQIDSLVENDPTAFYTYDEYCEAAETLYSVVQLRGQSIAGQVNDTIPSTAAGQREDNSTLIDAGDLDISVMGTMDSGGNMGGEFQQQGGNPSDSDSSSSTPNNTSAAPGGGGFAPGNFTPGQFGGTPPGNTTEDSTETSTEDSNSNATQDTTGETA